MRKLKQITTSFSLIFPIAFPEASVAIIGFINSSVTFSEYDSSTAFNSASAKLTFDKDLLSVQTISKASSALSLWAVEPSSSNADGTINFEGGNTTPLSGKKTLLTITFKTLKEGSAKVEFSSASVLAADGKGTDIAGAKNPAEFTITAGSADPTPPPSPADPSPGISCPDH